MKTSSFTFFLLAVTITGYCQKTGYLKTIQPISVSATAFPDSLYKSFDWQSFEQWRPANQLFDINNPDYHLLNAAIFYYTNSYRQKMKRHTLKFSPELRNAALYHSLQMSEKGFYKHENPYDKKMREPIQRIRNFETESDYYAENINKEFVLDYSEGKFFDKDSTGWYYTMENDKYIPILSYNELAKRIVKSWIESKSHRENILDRHFTHLGCGAVIDSKTLLKNNMPKIIATQNFSGNIITDLYNHR